MGYDIKRNASGVGHGHGTELPPRSEPFAAGSTFVDDNDGVVYIWNPDTAEWKAVGSDSFVQLPSYSVREQSDLVVPFLMIHQNPTIDIPENATKRLYLSEFMPTVVTAAAGLATDYRFHLQLDDGPPLPGLGDPIEDCYIDVTVTTDGDVGPKMCLIGLYDSEALLSSVTTFFIVQANTWTPPGAP